jgi:hypothetical protein
MHYGPKVRTSQERLRAMSEGAAIATKELWGR